MKRLSREDPSPSLISMCATTEEQKIVYDRELQLQTLIEGGYEEEEASMVMECGQKKRRLSLDQVKALERNFDIDNKLEPDRKQKLALELSLQPRQVAVWFQNRRARWKTKQLERDYSVLKATYDSLKLSLESLQTNNKELIKQIKKLRLKLKEMNPDPLNADLNEELGFEFDEPEPEPEIEIAQAPPPPPPVEELVTPKQSSQSTDLKDPVPSDSGSSAILNSDEIQKPAAAFEASAPVMIPQSHEYGNGAGFDFLSLCDPTCYNNHMYQVKMEEHNFLGDEEEAACCSFFSEVEQTPMLHWFTSTDNWQSTIQLE